MVSILSRINGSPAQAEPGLFQGFTDIGRTGRSGSVQYEASNDIYTIAAGGENIWGRQDAFSFLWKKTAGDLCLTADVRLEGRGRHEHRKAGCMVRGGLGADAPYADVVVHGDGLVSFQYRLARGGGTAEVKSALKAPVRLQLERHGDQFSVSLAKPGGPFQPVATITIRLADPVYAGLGVCSHDSSEIESARFSRVKLQERGAVPDSVRRIESTLETIDIATGERCIVHRALEHFEAPNWSRDGQYLVFNSNGRLYRIPVSGGEPELIPTAGHGPCNNDHGFSPDGTELAMSCHLEDHGSIIYVVPVGGGKARRITEKGPSYWHGWSPDGGTLAYCARRNGEYDIYSTPAAGGAETRLTAAAGLDDGPDYSADGRHIYFNSERSGQMHIWRMRSDGSQQQQITSDTEFADWFPHPSPDGQWIVFLSYSGEVQGHPADKDVVLRLMPVEGGDVRTLAILFGGQGTINVPSWSPGSDRVAFVSYLRVGPRGPVKSWRNFPAAEFGSQ